MEYAKNGDLLNLISKKGVLSEAGARAAALTAEARVYFREIINALEYCHLHGISHRDLKLENVLLSDHKMVKFGDFGLSDKMEHVKLTAGQNDAPGLRVHSVRRA